MMDRLSVLVAGKVAQKVLFGKISAQIESDKDSKNVTQIATEMVQIYGMSPRVGQVNLSQARVMNFENWNLKRFFGFNWFRIFTVYWLLYQDIPFSDGTKGLIDFERNRVINEAVQTCEKLLSEHKDELQKVVDFLVSKEIIHTADLENILGAKKKEDLPEPNLE